MTEKGDYEGKEGEGSDSYYPCYRHASMNPFPFSMTAPLPEDFITFQMCHQLCLYSPFNTQASGGQQYPNDNILLTGMPLTRENYQQNGKKHGNMLIYLDRFFATHWPQFLSPR